jgi:hypothetical protein
VERMCDPHLVGKEVAHHGGQAYHAGGGHLARRQPHC